MLFIPVADLNLETVQCLREVEGLPPDPTLKWMIDEAGSVRAPDLMRVEIPGSSSGIQPGHLDVHSTASAVETVHGTDAKKW